MSGTDDVLEIKDQNKEQKQGKTHKAFHFKGHCILVGNSI